MSALVRTHSAVAEDKNVKKKRRKKRKQKDIFDIPGVHKIVLSELAQKITGYVIVILILSELISKY